MQQRIREPVDPTSDDGADDAAVEHSSSASTVTALCVECGEVLEVKNIAVFLLAVHLAYGCSSTTGTLHG